MATRAYRGPVQVLPELEQLGKQQYVVSHSLSPFRWTKIQISKDQFLYAFAEERKRFFWGGADSNVLSEERCIR